MSEKGNMSKSSNREKRTRKKSDTVEKEDNLNSKQFMFVASKLGSGGDEVFIRLGLSLEELDDIKTDNPSNSKRQRTKALQEAYKKHGKSGFSKKLEKALVKTGNKIVYDEFIEEFGNQSPAKKSKYDKEVAMYWEPSKCVVAGILKSFKSTPLISIKKAELNIKTQLQLGVKAISGLIEYGDSSSDVRLSVLLHDGATVLKGIAFSDAAKKFAKILNEGSHYVFRNYTFKSSDKRYECTNFQVVLHKTTECEEVKNENWFGAPDELRHSIDDIKRKENEKLLVSTSVVKIAEIGELFKPKKTKYLREIYVFDDTASILVKFWLDEDEDFEYRVHDLIKLQYFKQDIFDDIFFLEQTDLSKTTKVEGCGPSSVTVDTNFNGDLLNAVRMSVAELVENKETKHHVIVDKVRFRRFRKLDGTFLFKKCIVQNHGRVEPKKNGRFFCGKCKKGYNKAKDVVSISAQIEDDSGEQAWVNIYTEAAEMLVGDEFDVFLAEDTSQEERFQILDDIASRKRKYRLEVKIQCTQENEEDDVQRRIVVRNVEKL